MKRIGISTGAIQRAKGPVGALELAAKCGFDSVDFSLECYGGANDPIYKSDEMMLDHFGRLKERAKELGLTVSQTHGRCKTYTPDQAQCEKATRQSERDLFATSILGTPACVIHNINSSYFTDATPDFIHKKEPRDDVNFFCFC